MRVPKFAERSSGASLRRIQICKEFRWGNAQRFNDLEDVQKCEVVLATLDAAHVAAIYSTGIAKALLRKTQFFTAATHGRSKQKQRWVLGQMSLGSGHGDIFSKRIKNHHGI